MPVYVADLGSQNLVDFVKLARTECVGVILRATRSNEHDDMLYRVRRDAARAVGLKVGAYAFNTGETPAIQVTRFLDWAQIDDDIAGYLDLERNPSGTGQMTLSAVIEWLDRYDQTVGRRCGLYSGDVIKSLAPEATASERDFLAAHPLWGCEYGPRWRNLDCDGQPLPWPAPFLWQFTGDDIGPEPHNLDGLGRGADLSIFNGTADQLRAAWALPSIPAPGAVA